MEGLTGDMRLGVLPPRVWSDILKCVAHWQENGRRLSKSDEYAVGKNHYHIATTPDEKSVKVTVNPMHDRRFSLERSIERAWNGANRTAIVPPIITANMNKEAAERANAAVAAAHEEAAKSVGVVETLKQELAALPPKFVLMIDLADYDVAGVSVVPYARITCDAGQPQLALEAPAPEDTPCQTTPTPTPTVTPSLDTSTPPPSTPEGSPTPSPETTEGNTAAISDSATTPEPANPEPNVEKASPDSPTGTTKSKATAPLPEKSSTPPATPTPEA